MRTYLMPKYRCWNLDMAIVHIIKLLIFVCCFMSELGVAIPQYDDECSVTRCHRGSKIRFPFRGILLDKVNTQLEPDHCGVPGFELSCNASDHYPVLKFEYQVNTSQPGLHLSFSVEAYVDSIDYKSQQLHFSSKSTNIMQHSGYYLPPSPFKQFALREYQVDNPRYLTDYTFYKCSSRSGYIGIIDNIIEPVPSLSGHNFQVYVVYSHLRTTEALLTSCTKLYNISHTPLFGGGLSWSQPNCRDCEGKGLYCKFKANITTETQCYPIPKGHSSHKTGKVGGILLLSFILVASCYAIYLYKQKKNYQQKIEMFLEDYKALKPTRFSYADIKKISSDFKIKVGEGGYGSVFKGQLSNDVPVAVKILNDKVDAKGTGEDFINEVSTIGLIHHVNVVRLVGYCADGCRRALVYEFLPNDSLEKYVYSKENRRNGFLGWEKMEEIALGIAKGIEYLHQGCAQRILHFDIKPNNILLDQNFNPKIADFGLAKLCTKGQSIVSMTMARGTVGYIAPEVFSRNFGKVSSKSDVYSFGMLLLEMVGARNHTSITTENTSEVYFPEWIYHQLEQGRETNQIEEEGDSKIKRKLTIVGLWCVNWHPADRPSMKHVIQMLEGEDCPTIPPNPFSSSSRNAFAAASARPFTNELEVISEAE